MGNNRSSSPGEILDTYKPADSVPNHFEYLTMTEAARRVLEDIITRNTWMPYIFSAGVHEARNKWLSIEQDAEKLGDDRRKMLEQELADHHKEKYRGKRKQRNKQGATDSHQGSRAA